MNIDAELRGYQHDAVDAALNWISSSPPARGGIIVAPTGSGKSHIIAAICRNLPKDTFALLLAPTREIVVQDVDKLFAAGVSAGICCAGLNHHDRAEEHRVFVATPASLKPDQITRHMANVLVIIDEAHRVNIVEAASLFRKHITRVLELWADAKILGFTATPWRLGQGADVIGGDLWRDEIYRISTTELINAGYLVPITPYAVEIYTQAELMSAKHGPEYRMGALGRMLLRKMGLAEPDTETPDADTGTGYTEAFDKIVRAMQMHDRKHMLVYCPTVETAKEVAYALHQRGVSCAVIWGGMPPRDRDEVLAQYKRGDITAIVNCAVLTTGFDAPATDMIVLLIATMSRAKHFQILGRGMRPAPGKKDCLLVDCGGNVLRHGLDPDQPTTPRMETCTHCHRVQEVPCADDVAERALNGTPIACDCGAHLVGCPLCGTEWWTAPTEPEPISCPTCRRRIWPPLPTHGIAGGGGAKRHLYTEIPYTYARAIRSASGKTYYAFAPISLTPYLSARKTPCLLVKNAFQGRNAYIWLTDTPQRAAMTYITTGTWIQNHRRDPVPDHEWIWARCKNPALKIVAAAGTVGTMYPKLTHFLVFSTINGYESVEIAKNYITQEKIEVKDTGK